jgi:hypothetical protein
MKRLLVRLCTLVVAVALPSGVLAPPSTASVAPVLYSAPAQAVDGHASGTVIGVARGSFAIEAGGARLPIVDALTAAANAVTAGNFPYVYGGGHAEAAIASTGIKGPGYNGRRLGFDCSGSVAAVLAGAGLWPIAAGVPNDAGVVAQLQREHLIAPGRGRGAEEVTFYDDPGVHIFMNIDGQFFGTSDGGGGGNAAGGAGWLDDGAWDATSGAYKPYRLLPGVLHSQTTFARVLTFRVSGAPGLAHGLLLGATVHVAYTQAPNGRLSAQSVS